MRIKRPLLLFLVLPLLIFGSNGNSPQQEATQSDPPPSPSFDVIVVGAEPEGVAAAVAAARMGAKTLLIEKREAVGGLWTLAKLNTIDIMFARDAKTNKRILAQRGMFKEIMDELGINYMGWEHWFDVGEMQKILNRLIEEQPTLTLMLNTSVVEALTEGSEQPAIIGVKIKPLTGEQQMVTGKVFIDATGDADLVAMIGEKGRDYFLGRADMLGKEEMMATTLILEIGGTRNLKGYYRDVTDGINQRLFSEEDRVSIGQGFNIGWNRDGTVLINSMKVYGVNGLDEESIQEGLAIGKKYAPQVVDYLNGKLTGKAIQGFEKAYLKGTPDYLYIRETRHIKGLVKVTFQDILKGVVPPDTIALGTYPMDLQPYIKGENYYSVCVTELGYPWQEIYKKTLYGIPFRSLVPKNIDSLLVVGRPISADSIAAGSIRVVPNGIPVGESAGIAAVMALRDKKSVHEFANDADSIKNLRDFLRGERGFLIDKEGLKRG